MLQRIITHATILSERCIMTNRQKNKRTMYKAVTAFFAKWKTVMRSILAFAEEETRYYSLLDDIDAKAGERDNAGAGTYTARDAASESLIDLLLAVGAGLVSYASKKKLTDVKEIAKLKPSKLERLADVELKVKAKAIYDLAVQYATDLAAYNVSAEKIAALQSAITTFTKASEAIAGGASGTSGAVKSLKDLFLETDDLIKDQFDNFVRTLKTTQPQLFAEYLTARRIHDLGGSQKETPAPAPAATAVAAKA
jgi:hypothetical protein